MATIDYLPVATGSGAEVDPQSNFVGSGYQENGFTAGIAEPAEANKVWRQSSMFAAAMANAISQVLGGIDVLDDGNRPALTTLIIELIEALASSASLPKIITVAFSPTPVFDCSTANPIHAVFALTLTGNVTSSTLINVRQGQLVTFQLNQDGTGGHTFVWPTNVTGASNVLGENPSDSNVQSFVSTPGWCRPIGGMTVS